ncbi:hypothetical protein CURE108131_22965 [Cupriavidus respiraculi]|uniref:Uncharacterized protein n=1 Tax=Cupriavidus respiraculi TaxID=195930 RepID=A0ABN7YHQ7_9BURK|nr:hypothetical protein LMG21510_02002 [Cupriavidus respiraculi]
MDQVTRKRMHKGLCKAFDDLTANLEGTTLMPAMAMRAR